MQIELPRDRVIKDIEVARGAPEMAVLSVVAHGRRPGAEYIARAAILASRDLDSRRSAIYPDFVYALLSKVARMALEKLLDFSTYEPQSPWLRKQWLKARREGRAEGRAEARAEVLSEVLLRQLRGRQFRVTAKVRARVEGCDDPDTLMRWAERVVTARRLADVFADDER